MDRELDIRKYAEVMVQIKERTQVIDLFLENQASTHYLPANIESIGLQFRKIFELIVFASLAANREKYSEVYSDYSKHWEAAKLIKKLKAVNPHFYPKPITETPVGDPRASTKMETSQNDYLTEDELIEAHGRCGALMHAANPCGTSIQYDYYQQNFPVWRARFIKLLNSHRVSLLDDTGFYLFHMKEAARQGISYYYFGLVDAS